QSASRKRNLNTEATMISSTDSPSVGIKQNKPDILPLDNSMQQMEQPPLPGTPAYETTDGNFLVDVQTSNEDNAFENDRTTVL
ncbi:hypothetical protein PMAYCL1PPCAC_22408, partial [Pristionchus mayeri]